MERQRHRLLSATVLATFSHIAKKYKDFKNAAATIAHHQRRAFNRLGGYSYPRNGLQECERRRNQIAAGSLRVENGLTYETPPFSGYGR